MTLDVGESETVVELLTTVEVRATVPKRTRRRASHIQSHFVYRIWLIVICNVFDSN